MTGTHVQQTQQVNLFHHACSGLSLTINEAIGWDSAGLNSATMSTDNTDFGAALNNQGPLVTTKHRRMLRSHFEKIDKTWPVLHVQLEVKPESICRNCNYLA